MQLLRDFVRALILSGDIIFRFMISANVNIRKNSLKQIDYCFIKTDLLGDVFVWMRTFKYFDFSDNSVLVVVREGHKDLLSRYLPSNIEILEINTINFKSNLFERFKVFNKLSKYNPSKVLNARVSRSLVEDDALCLFFSLSRRFGSNRLNKTQSALLARINSFRYSQIIELGSLTSEMDANSYMFEVFTQKKQCKPIELKVNWKLTPSKSRQILIFPFASDSLREWGLKNYLELATYISNIREKVLLVVPAQDLPRLISFLDEHPNYASLSSVVVTPSAVEMAELIRDSQFVICNDSGPAHLANFLGTPRIAIIGGGHKERYYPMHLCSPDSVEVFKPLECFNCDWKCSFPITDGRFPCLNMVTYPEVQTQVAFFLGRLSSSKAVSRHGDF